MDELAQFVTIHKIKNEAFILKICMPSVASHHVYTYLSIHASLCSLQYLEMHK